MSAEYQKRRREDLQSYNVGKDIKELTKLYDHINWSSIVKKAILERVRIEEELKSATK